MKRPVAIILSLLVVLGSSVGAVARVHASQQGIDGVGAGFFSCSEVVFPGATIVFSDVKGDGVSPPTGKWAVVGVLGGSITPGGAFSNTNFNLNVKDFVSAYPCFLTPQTQISIKGDCGIGVQIFLKSNTDAQGSFRGNLQCPVI